MGITDKAMLTKPAATDVWLTEAFGKGHGALLGRVTPSGTRTFYYRYKGTHGQVRLPIGPYSARGDGASGFTVAQARATALGWAALRREGQIVDLREHLAQLGVDRERAATRERHRLTDEHEQRMAAEEAAAEARERRLTVHKLFDVWRTADLQPRPRADGKRTGRVDGGQYVFEQFSRHVFPTIGSLAVEDVRKADLLHLLDQQKSAGKMRTANVLLADLKQMLAFAQERELIAVSPLAAVRKSKVGGPSVERNRTLSDEELRLLVAGIASANLQVRSATAVWLILATAVRVGELMGAIWSDALPPYPKARTARLESLNAAADADGVKLGIVDLVARTWHLPTSKNQRDHTIHLSDFALAQLEVLASCREVLRGSTTGQMTPWLFPATDNRRPVCVKSFGKQLADRQRPPNARLAHRSKATTALCLPGGRWTAHDLRRTAATLMARLGFGSDTINECLNHVQADRMARVYIQDRRQADQVRAFNALGSRLSELSTGAQPASNVLALRGAA